MTARVERRWAGRLAITYLAAAFITAGIAFSLVLPTIQPFEELDNSLSDSASPIVVVGMDVHVLRVEFHLQPQTKTGFPDGLTMVMNQHSAVSAADPTVGPVPPRPTGPYSFVVALPRALNVNTETALWEDKSGSSCTFSVSPGVEADLPRPARVLSHNYVVMRFTNSCSTPAPLYLNLMRIAPSIYERNSFSVALRLPPIAYFDHGSTVNKQLSSASGEMKNESCKKTTVLLDNYSLKPTEWLGAEPANIQLPAYRTSAIYWGGTTDRPVGWVAQERPPQSRIAAPCVTQGVGIDLSRPGAEETRTSSQVISGLFFGLASGLLIPGIESGAAWFRHRVSSP
jgi:hypothetical protein